METENHFNKDLPLPLDLRHPHPARHSMLRGSGLLSLLKSHFPPRLTNLPDQWLQCQANGSNVFRVLRVGVNAEGPTGVPRLETANPQDHADTGTSLIRKRAPLEPYHRPMPRVLGGSEEAERLLMGEVPL